MNKRFLCLALSVLTLLSGCNGGGAPGPAAGRPTITLDPVIGGVKGTEARLSVNIQVRRPGFATQVIGGFFDHALVRLAGSRLEKSREIMVPFGSFSSGVAVVTTLAGDGTTGLVNGTGSGARFNLPVRPNLDPAGNLVVPDDGGHAIRKVTQAGVVTTLSGDGTSGAADGTAALARYFNPGGVAVDKDGNVFVADQFNHTIRRISAGGVVTTYAGSGASGLGDGAATAAKFNQPKDVALDKDGNVYVADYNNQRIRKIARDGTVSTLAGSGLTGFGNGGFANGDATSARFNQPKGVALDKDGNVYVADDQNHRIRRVTPNGDVTSVAGDGTPGVLQNPGALAVDAAGTIFVADTGNNRIRRVATDGAISTIAGGSPITDADGTGTAAGFKGPEGIVIAGPSVLYVTDSLNHRIRRLDLPADRATGTVANLRPGDGYTLEVALYDAPAPAGKVVASGSYPATFSLAAGSQAITVTVDVTRPIGLVGTLPLAFSELFQQATANGPSQPSGAVVVRGDTLKILPGVKDPKGQLREVRLYLDGSPSASYLDGKRLATWFSDGFHDFLTWDTGSVHGPMVFGTEPGPSPTPTPNPFSSPSPTPTPSPTPSPVPVPSAVAAEGTPNHTLAFTMHDRNSPPDRDLIGVVKYDLTVVDPGSINVGLE